MILTEQFPQTPTLVEFLPVLHVFASGLSRVIPSGSPRFVIARSQSTIDYLPTFRLHGKAVVDVIPAAMSVKDAFFKVAPESLYPVQGERPLHGITFITPILSMPRQVSPHVSRQILVHLDPRRFDMSCVNRVSPEQALKTYRAYLRVLRQECLQNIQFPFRF